ncbi:MAG: pantoate--beta-alanine ligase [Halobacteriovoraceae bacterium]|nr:pantoate--beta-alanine ligase [Halobacteriovoraceae bacterium]|tara:strand:+ start:10912 stop:11664 length:753 start_codon:yes stop_codon:yes gene_type:complete
MLIIKNIPELKENLANLKGTRGFVPTMGALHLGHISLVKESLKNNDHTIVSIFVNPTQFDQKEDLENYPQTLENDLFQLEELGVDCIFLPNEKEMYPHGYFYKVEENHLSQILCGASRPGHFSGVLTIVLKLLNLIQADSAYFGLKDYQQFQLIKNMARDFFINTQIIGLETIREKDGLAMSSRNLRLSKKGRELAPQIYEQMSKNQSLEEIKTKLKKIGFEIDYLEEHFERRFIAARLEGIRLIDNVEI